MPITASDSGVSLRTAQPPGAKPGAHAVGEEPDLDINPGAGSAAERLWESHPQNEVGDLHAGGTV